MLYIYITYAEDISSHGHVKILSDFFVIKKLLYVKTCWCKNFILFIY